VSLTGKSTRFFGGGMLLTTIHALQLIKLLDIQKADHGVLTAMESRVLAGALNFKEKTVESVMTGIDRVTMLNVSIFLFSTLFNIILSLCTFPCETYILLYISFGNLNLKRTGKHNFCCQVNDRFDFNVLFRIYRSGHSRIPVYENNIHNIVGLVFAKDLTLISPDVGPSFELIAFLFVNFSNTRVGRFVGCCGY
jgi:CBS domain containing-hemolysin-like protein